MTETKIRMINVGKLMPHPDNPRKDLGDLSELAESIKAQGVLQNLTVVKLDKDSRLYSRIRKAAIKQLNDEIIKEYERDNNSEFARELTEAKQRIESWQEDITGYVVVIGHRRLAAAKMAGLKELPCIVAEMDEKTQLGTMLLENMQRSDLTVYEQAQGFQLMLDIGESVQGIAQATGFSESTIRRRTKLLSLDSEGFKAATARGATLMDFDELNKITDSERRDKLLQYLGTPEFSWHLGKAQKDEEYERNKAQILAVLQTFAQNITKEEARDLSYFTYVNCSSPNYKPPEIEGRSFYYLDSGIGFDLYIDKVADEPVAEKDCGADRAEKEHRRHEIAELNRRAFASRTAFMKNLTPTDADLAKAHIIKKACGLLAGDGMEYLQLCVYCGATGVDKSGVRGRYTGHEDLPSIGDVINGHLDNAKSDKERMKTLALCVYSMLEDDVSAVRDIYFQTAYVKNEKLEAVYDYLTGLGYVISAEEKALLDGSHELYEGKVEETGEEETPVTVEERPSVSREEYGDDDDWDNPIVEDDWEDKPEDIEWLINPDDDFEPQEEY